MPTDVMISSHPFHTGITLAATTYKSVHSNNKANKANKKGSLKKKRRKGTHKSQSKSKGSAIRRASNSTDRGSDGHVKAEEPLQSDSSVEIIVIDGVQTAIDSEVRKSKPTRSDIKSATKGHRESRRSKKIKTKLILTSRIKTVKNLTNISSNEIKIGIHKLARGISDLQINQIKDLNCSTKSSFNSTITLPQISKVVQLSNSPPKKLSTPRIYLSERQSKRLDEGISAAPPCTPENDFANGISYVPSLSDIRSQRAVKNRLTKLQKLYNEREQKEKMQQLQAEETTKRKSIINTTNQLKSWQRLQIYGLNNILAEIEERKFQQFSDSMKAIQDQ